MYIMKQDVKYIGFYFVQLIYLIIFIAFYYILYPKASRLLVNNMCMLMAVGFIMIARLNFDKCVKQFVIAVLGTVIMFMVPWLLKTVKSFRNFGWIYCITGLVLLCAVLLGSKVYGANLTLSIGAFSVQPAEFVKILYVMFVASMFNKSTTFKQTCIVTAFAALHVIILVLSTDLGAALIFFVVYIAMLYIATRKLAYAGAGLIAGAGASVIAYKLFAHVRARVIVWRTPWEYIDTSGYQICQSLFAISEEFGLIFSIALFLVCLNNLILMMNIASRCKTLFYRLVAVGLGVTYGVQVFLTVGGAIKFIPMTGVTLPFVSYGGSSILSSLIMFALINGMYTMRQDEGDRKDGRKQKAGQTKKKQKGTERYSR